MSNSPSRSNKYDLNEVGEFIIYRAAVKSGAPVTSKSTASLSCSLGQYRVDGVGCDVCIPCTGVEGHVQSRLRLLSLLPLSPALVHVDVRDYDLQDVGRGYHRCPVLWPSAETFRFGLLDICAASAGSMPGMANVSPPATIIVISAMLVSFRKLLFMDPVFNPLCNAIFPEPFWSCHYNLP